MKTTTGGSPESRRCTFDYLEAREPLIEFLTDFATVSRQLAIAVLDEARDALLERANPP